MTDPRLQRSIGRFTSLVVCLVAAMLGGVAEAQEAPRPSGQDPALRAFHSANGLLNRGMHELAVQEYRAFLSAFPNHEKASIARYGLGVCLFRLKQFEPAAAEFSQLRGVKEFPYAAEALLLLGQSCLEAQKRNEAAAAFEALLSAQPQHQSADDAAALIVETLYLDKQFDKVPAATQRLQKGWPESPQRDRAEYFLSLALIELKDYKRAAEALSGLVTRSPQGEFAKPATLLMAQSRHRAGEWTEAIDSYRRVLAFDAPDLYADALFGLAAALQQAGKADEALGAFDQFLHDHTDHTLAAEASFQRGRLLFERQELETAQKAFDDAAVRGGASFARQDEAAYWAAKCEFRRQRFAEAAARLEKAISVHGRSSLLPEMTYDLAVAFVQSGRPEAAGAPLEQLLTLHPQHALAADALYLQAMLAHEAGQHESSYALCQTFLARHQDHPTEGSVAYLAAENLFLLGKDGDAAQAFAQFAEEFPEHAQATQARFRLGVTLHRTGKLDAARAELERIAKGRDTAAEFWPALLLLGDIAFQQDRFDQAATLLGDYLSLNETMHSADDAWLKLGLSHARSNRAEPAIEAFTTLIEQHAESPLAIQAHFERGQLRLLSNDLAGARADFEETAASGRSSFETHAMSHLGAIALRENQPAQAATWYAKSASTASEPAVAAEAMFQQGRALMASGDFAAADQVFGSLLQNHGDSKRAPLAVANRALAMARLERHADALKSIDLAIQSTDPSIDPPLRARLLYERAWCERETDQVELAATTYRRILADHGEQPIASHASLELSELEINAERFKEAADALEMLRTRSDLTDEVAEPAAYRLGICQYELEQFSEAVSTLEEFIQAWPSSKHLPSAHLLCGESLFKSGKPEAAAAHFAKIIEKWGDESSAMPARLRLGECQAAMQRWPESETTFQQYLDKHGQSDMWYQAQFGIGWARENQGRHEPAVEAYRKVIERHGGPTAARAQFQIGECLFAQNKHEDAARELLKVDILYGYAEWSAAALFEAGRCFEHLSRPDDARQQFEQVTRKYPDSRWAALASQRLGALAGAAPAP